MRFKRVLAGLSIILAMSPGAALGATDTPVGSGPSNAAPAVIPLTAPSPPFTECPALAADTSCSRLIFIDDSGATVLSDPSQGSYDGIEDQLVGVLNTSGITIPGLPLTGTNIFGFDGDGVCGTTAPAPSTGWSPRPAGCPFGPTGYEGPGTSFSITNANTGSVIFTGGLASGKSAWFTLEEPPSTSICIPTGKVTISSSNPTSGHFNDPVSFSAHVTNTCTNAAVPGVTVNFQLDSQAVVSATTNASGEASVSITPTEAAGSYTLTVSFPGSTSLLFSSATSSFAVTLEDTKLTSPTTLQVFAQGGSATLSATLTDPADTGENEGAAPIAAQPVTMSLGSQSCTGTTNASGMATCTISPVTVGLGSQTITDSFTDTTNHYQSATFTQHAIVFAFLTKAAFVVADNDATGTVQFWGAQWDTKNVPSVSGPVSDAFKGFADTTSEPPACGKNWSADPGNSSGPPANLPAFLGVIVSNSASKAGATISGNTLHIVVVTPNPGYVNDPGHPGTGTMVATFC